MERKSRFGKEITGCDSASHVIARLIGPSRAALTAAQRYVSRTGGL